jgi:hypothetical protein
VTTTPATHTLQHTGLQVPAEHPRVVSLTALPMRGGNTIVARVRVDSRDVGTIEDKADGGGLHYDYTDPAYGYPWLNEFASACRQNGEPVSTARVLILLVEEHEVCGHLLKALADDKTLARFLYDGYTEHIVSLAITVPVQESDLIGLDAELAEFAPEFDGHWEVWTGTVWRPVTDPAPDREQDGTDR